MTDIRHNSDDKHQTQLSDPTPGDSAFLRKRSAFIAEIRGSFACGNIGLIAWGIHGSFLREYTALVPLTGRCGNIGLIDWGIYGSFLREYRALLALIGSNVP